MINQKPPWSHATYTRRLDLQRDQQVYTQGDRPGSVYYQVVAGVIRLEIASPEGRMLLADFKGPGERFGVADALRGCDRAESAIVRSFKAKVDVFEVPLLTPLLAEMITELVEFNRYLLERDRMTATERVGLYLYRLSDVPAHLICLAHHEIGDFVGCSREAVTRAFSTFSEGGILRSVPYRKVRVTDRPKLEAWLIHRHVLAPWAGPAGT